MDQVGVVAIEVPSQTRRYRGWFLALGSALAALGVLAIVSSRADTVASTCFYGVILAVAATIECASAILAGKCSGSVLHFLGALLLGVTAFLLLRYQTMSAEGLTVLMEVFFIAGGALEIVAGAFQLVSSVAAGPLGMRWHIVSGVILTLFGIFVNSQWPAPGSWVIGVFIGVALLFRSLTCAAIAFGRRELEERFPNDGKLKAKGNTNG